MHASSVSVTMNNTSAIARPSSYRKSYEAEMSIEKKSISLSRFLGIYLFFIVLKEILKGIQLVCDSITERFFLCTSS